jgi:Tol biopolymer transport system component
MYEPRLDDLPEAVPLRRVSPVWRLVAILGLAGLAGLMLAVLALVTWVIHLHEELDDYQSGAVPAPPVWAPTTVPVQPAGELDPDPDPGLNAANLPYPVKEDLRFMPKAAPPDKDKRQREQFLKLSQEVWKSPREHALGNIAVSPDGMRLAYFLGSDLVAGPFGNVQKFEIGPQRQGNENRDVDAVAANRRVYQLVGFPTWSADSQSIYFASAGGRIYRFNCDTQQVEKLPFLGQLPAPMPNDPDRLVFVRYEAELKADGAGGDKGVLVVGNLRTGETRTIKVAGRVGDWTALAVSPDGKHLAALRSWSLVPRSGIVLIDLDKGTSKEAGPPVSGALTGPLSWTADGTALTYARPQEPAPPDCWSDDDDEFLGSSDLFQWDLKAGKETRLSRGGGFTSATLTTADDLFFVDRAGPFKSNGRLQLRRVPLRSARKFAASRKEPVFRDVAAWTALFGKVCEEANIAGNLDDAALTADTMTRLADTFGRIYRGRFNEAPPADPSGLDRLDHELRQLRWEPAHLAQARLVLGAVHGEYLRQKHGARWHLVKGPLVKPVAAPGEPTPEDAFGYAVNPFQVVTGGGPGNDREEDDGGSAALSIDGVLRLAEGRPLVLSNDRAAARALIAKEGDPDLDRSRQLLKDGKNKDAEALLLAMLGREPHRDNLYLMLQVCQLLYEHRRLAALRRIVEERCSRPPPDARLFNYLGIALLDGDTGQALNAFKKSLRCDLHYGPAYLNLAKAYEKLGETANARAVLKRCIDQLPVGPYADDALRRLVALEP